MICPKCRRRMVITSAIRSRLAHGDTEHKCRYCGNIIKITQEDLRKSDLSYIARKREERLCTRCGQVPVKDGYATCEACRKKDHERKQKLKEIVGWTSEPKKKQGETLDDIARKARSHGLSYGKYLAARARGMYLSEVDE